MSASTSSARPKYSPATGSPSAGSPSAGSVPARALSAASFTISPQGPFSLAEAAAFGFGQRDGRDADGVMRLAFCVDGYAEQVGIEVRQDAAGDVHAMAFMRPGTDLGAVRAQVARVLSLDYDASEFVRIGERDPVIGRLQAAAPGLRPPLFYSPYEAAAWSVLSARRPARQMMQVRALLSEAHGRVFDLAGQRLAAFPTPGQLLRVGSFPGLGADKMERLHGVARAALEGRLDVGALKAMGPDSAMAELQSIKGIGPFYSALIVVRGTGFTDVLPVNAAPGSGLGCPALRAGRAAVRGPVPGAGPVVAAVPYLGRRPHPRRLGPACWTVRPRRFPQPDPARGLSRRRCPGPAFSRLARSGGSCPGRLASKARPLPSRAAAGLVPDSPWPRRFPWLTWSDGRLPACS